jgi:protein-S-isoprenylcysteine O-methyltransferase Ste14
MKILGSALALTAFFSIYGIVHSWLASLPVKNWLRSQLGPSVDRWYRLAYNIFAVVTFMPMLLMMGTLPQKTLYVVSSPWRWLMVAGQLIALGAAGITVIQTGLFHFFGLSQLVTNHPTANTPLNFNGMYRWVRHPLYFFSLLFLWLTPVMTTNSLTAYILFTLYFQFGSEYEERRMVKEYGEEYNKYRKTVPRLIPLPGHSYPRAKEVANDETVQE